MSGVEYVTKLEINFATTDYTVNEDGWTCTSAETEQEVSGREKGINRGRNGHVASSLQVENISIVSEKLQKLILRLWLPINCQCERIKTALYNINGHSLG